MHILSDDGLPVTSSDEAINVFANKTITLISGQSKVRLDGASITFECPGTFTVKGGSHAFAGPRAQPAILTNLLMLYKRKYFLQ